MIITKNGKVTKGLGGLYEVRVEDEQGVSRIACRAKGNLKRDEEKVLIGDNVKVEIDESTPDGVIISEIYERKNSLIRPLLQILIICSSFLRRQNPHRSLKLWISLFLLRSITELNR